MFDNLHMKLHTLIKFVFLVFCGLSTPYVAAQTCSPKLQITYPDGEKGCLTDLPIAKQKVRSWGSPLSEVIDSAISYSIAASAICPDVYVQKNYQTQRIGTTDARTASQDKDTLGLCDKRCDCAIIAHEGQVLVSKATAQALGTNAGLELAQQELNKLNKSKQAADDWPVSCSLKLRITYPDGEKACLSDLPLAKKEVRVWGQPLAEVLDSAISYSVAASAICPDVYVQKNYQNQRMGTTETRTAAQDKDALGLCDKKCDCAIVAHEGSMLISKPAAQALATSNSVQVAQAELQRLSKGKPQEPDAWPTSCSPQLRITYPDGQKGCMTDLPIAKQNVKAWGQTLSNVLDSAVSYSIAASATCPDVHVQKNYQQRPGPNSSKLAAQDRDALGLCDKKCDCAIVAHDGVVLVNRSIAMVLGANSGNQLAQQDVERSNQLKQQEAQQLAAANKLKEQKLADEARLKELDRQAQINKQKQEEQLAQANLLRQQQRFDEEARLKDQILKDQELKRREQELQIQEAKFREQQRLAEEQRLKEQDRQIQEAKKREQDRLAQESKGTDRELLLQLAAELTRLRAEAEAAKNAAAAAPAPSAPAAPEVVAAAPAKPAVVYANRKALVIGNDSYKYVAQLSNAREDAKTMAENLKNVGYQVTLKLDVTEKELKASLRQFKGQVESGDEVAFFYAGHGVQLANSNYLVPIDVAGEAEDQLRDEAIALQRLLDDMNDKKVKFTLAMVDACRDNPFKSSGRALGGNTRGLAPTTAATGQMIVFSAGTGQQALDKLGPSDKNKNGVFTRVFVKEMQKPGVSIDRVVRNVRTEVVNLAKSVGHDQVPAIYDQVVGEFYFKN